MKIKIIDAEVMGVSNKYSNGDIVEVEYDVGNEAYHDMEEPYVYLPEWEGKYFEFVEDENAEWSGEGLPPVGTVCECITEKDVYLPCKVIAHGKDNSGYVIVHFFPNDYGIKVDWTRTGCQPIKSEKQKEIDKIASELLESVNKNGEDFRHLEWEIAEHLYNAGLRFTEDLK